MRLFILLMLVSFNAFSYGPYDAQVERVKDGDTILLDVQLWPGLEQEISLRLDGINTPEKRGSPDCEKIEAQKAADFTSRFVAGGWVTLTDVRLGKYAGRALGKISVDGVDLGQALLDAGLAREYHGGARGAWCDG